MMTVGRFAPTPSGRMHLGNLFTALTAWLSVRAQGGKLLLRIEDLDPERSKPEFADALRDDLHWLGLDWDEEMPAQSGRTALYAQYFDRLPVYPCYCSRNELHAASAPHASDGRLLYAGTCRNLTPAERAAQRRSPAWRVRVPERTVTFTDGVFGLQTEVLNRECGDFIVRRSDGVYAYQLAVVCDDALGGVTEVVRGCDLLDSTPRQLWLYEMLGFAAPKFYHLPLLTAPDGRRLSKRDRDLDMAHLREHFQPEELLGRLAALTGMIPAVKSISAAELTGFFDWKKIKTQNIPVRHDFLSN